MSAPKPAKLGIVAGAGALPGLLAAACRAEGRPYFILGLNGFADDTALGQAPDARIRMGEAGQGFALMRQAGVTEIVMAGGVRRPTLAILRPDIKTALFFARIIGRSLGDDGLLRAVIAEIEREGFSVVGPHEILTSLLAPSGPIGMRTPDAEAQRDIKIGIVAALELGQADIGQAVVVRNGAVVGREDAAGTAALIARSGAGGVLVKMKKPQQDRRADLPAIGPDTIAQAAAAKLSGIAVEAGGTLVLDLPAVRKAADTAGVFVVGVTP